MRKQHELLGDAQNEYFLAAMPCFLASVQLYIDFLGSTRVILCEYITSMSVVNSFSRLLSTPVNLNLTLLRARKCISQMGTSAVAREPNTSTTSWTPHRLLIDTLAAFLFFLFERKSSQPTRFFATNSFVVPTRPLPPTHSANCECFLRLTGSDRISSSGCDPLGYPKSINNQPWDNCNFQLFARQTNRAFHRFDLSTDCVCVRGCRDYIKLNCTTKLVKQSSMRSQAD